MSKEITFALVRRHAGPVDQLRPALTERDHLQTCLPGFVETPGMTAISLSDRNGRVFLICEPALTDTGLWSLTFRCDGPPASGELTASVDKKFTIGGRVSGSGVERVGWLLRRAGEQYLENLEAQALGTFAPADRTKPPPGGDDPARGEDSGRPTVGGIRQRLRMIARRVGARTEQG